MRVASSWAVVFVLLAASDALAERATLGGTGALGGAAAAFNSKELAAPWGMAPHAGIGNRTSDAEAYGNLGIDPDRRFLYRLDEAFTGVDVETI